MERSEEPKTQPEYEIFIAHAGCETQLAEELFHYLVEMNVSPFLDTLCLGPEDSIYRIPAVQRTCLATAVLASSRWTHQHYASEEIALAVELERRGEGHKIVPVWLEDVRHQVDSQYGIWDKLGIYLWKVDGIRGVARALESSVRNLRAARAAHAARTFELRPEEKQAIQKLKLLKRFSAEVEIEDSVVEEIQRKILIELLFGKDTHRPDRLA